MRYPSFLKPQDTIGCCAPSFGIAIEPYITRYQSAKETFQNLGYHFVETESVTSLVNAESANKLQRAKEFESLWFDPEVDFIFSVAGGERMIEILPHLSFQKISSSEPKFFVGYSDNTCLTFLLTTLCDIASIYGQCLPEYGMRPWDQSLQSAYEVMTGTKLLQHSFHYYQVEELNKMPGHELDGYHLTELVEWKPNCDVKFEGRLIGGCLDVLTLFVGTPYDRVKEFVNRYQNDGIVWYLESCDLNGMGTLRSLWQLRQADWFQHCKGFLFGRPKNNETLFGVSYIDAVESILHDLNVPILYDVDIGHVPPTLTLVNGAYVKVYSVAGNGVIETILK